MYGILYANASFNGMEYQFQYRVEYFACNVLSNDKLPFASQLFLTDRKAMSISLQYHEYVTTLPIETHQAAKESYEAL